MKNRLPAMLGRPPLAAACLALCLSGAGAAAQDAETLEFKGSGSTVTRAFEVEAPWILDWRIFSDYPQSMSIEIALLDATTGLHRGLVKQTKQIGTGVKLFDEGGSYKLRVDSDLARWQVLIREVSEEEAERYTPKSESVLGDQWFRKRGERQD